MQRFNQNEIIQETTNLDNSIEEKIHAIHVLHVDDDQSQLEISKQILTSLGAFEIDSVCSVDNAFEKLTTKQYDVLISDYEMPQKNGLTFLKELRQKNIDIPFILFTGKGREEVAVKALNLGADHYINKHGDPEAVYGELSHNIKLSMERNKARTELQKRDARFAKLASQTPGMLYQFLKRPDGTYCVPYTSENINNIFGCSPKDVKEDFAPIAKAILPEDLDKVINSIEESAVNMTQWQCEYRVQLPGQQIRWLWGQSVPERLEDGSILWNGYNADITECKQVEQMLKQAEEKHRTLLDSANVLIQSVNAECKFVYVNDEWKKALGYTDKDLEKITMMDVIRKDQLMHCMSIFKSVIGGESIHGVETVFITKDGREIVVHGNACPIFKEGKFVSTDAFFLDITERKKNEEQLKESRRRIEIMNEKLSVVGGLTRHDVRNKLSAVTGQAYLLKKKHGDQPDIVEGLRKMEQAVAESVRIFEFAKMYEQLGVEELTYIDVQTQVKQASALFSASLPKIINECQGLTVLADSFLSQLFYNLVDNTIKYGEKTTTIKVHYEKTDQDNLLLFYEDNGVGVPFENKAHLFKEGFSTGGSTGFGLFLTKKMMDVYGWEIEENGEPGKGAKFTITIPKINQNGKINYQTPLDNINCSILSQTTIGELVGVQCRPHL